jgi:hypothetical protein
MGGPQQYPPLAGESQPILKFCETKTSKGRGVQKERAVPTSVANSKSHKNNAPLFWLSNNRFWLSALVLSSTRKLVAMPPIQLRRTRMLRKVAQEANRKKKIRGAQCAAKSNYLDFCCSNLLDCACTRRTRRQQRIMRREALSRPFKNSFLTKKEKAPNPTT